MTTFIRLMLFWEITAVSKMTVFWVVSPCSLVEVCLRFGGPCYLHYQGDELDISTVICIRKCQFRNLFGTPVDTFVVFLSPLKLHHVLSQCVCYFVMVFCNLWLTQFGAVNKRICLETCPVCSLLAATPAILQSLISDVLFALKNSSIL